MKRKYRCNWDEDMSDAEIELYCYRHQGEIEKIDGELKGMEYHMIQAIRLMFVPEYLTWHKWLEDHIHIWCNNRFATVWGPAASSKSNSFGLLALMDWWSAPNDTCTFVCSTDKKSLERRIWESIVRYFNLYAGRAPGKISKMRTAIINSQDMDRADEVKAGIHGVAVRQGTVEDAKSALIGAHLPYVRMIIDEMQGTRRAAVEARGNLSKGCKDFKLIGIGNPMSLLDPLGEFSEPVDGWDKVKVEDESWKTKNGMCYHFDGFKSPAVIEEGGAEKYPFLINEEQIEEDIASRGGEADHPDIWSMCRGFVPPEGYGNTVLTEAMLIMFHMFDHVTWQYDYKTIAACDPAFSADGDKCLLQVARIGRAIDNTVAIEFQNPIYIQIIEAGRDFGFGPRELAVDETSTQSLSDVLENDKRFGKGVLRVQFGSAPSSLKVSNTNRTLCKDYYKNKMTEMWYTFAEFARNNHIRGMSKQAARDLCERKTIHAVPKRIESKREMQGRLSRSPDDGDGVCMVCELVRQRLGMHPGDHESFISGKGRNNPYRRHMMSPQGKSEKPKM